MDPKRLPSHSELYAKIGQLAHPIFRIICSQKGWTSEWKTIFGKNKEINYDTKLEERYWDILYTITKVKERKVQKLINKFDGINIGVEYKSSIKEWGKQFDDYLRQIKKRMDKETYHFTLPILLTFDERMEQYRDALNMNDIDLVIIPYKKVLQFLNIEKKSESKLTKKTNTKTTKTSNEKKTNDYIVSKNKYKYYKCSKRDVPQKILDKYYNKINEYKKYKKKLNPDQYFKTSTKRYLIRYTGRKNYYNRNIGEGKTTEEPTQIKTKSNHKRNKHIKSNKSTRKTHNKRRTSRSKSSSRKRHNRK